MAFVVPRMRLRIEPLSVVEPQRSPVPPFHADSKLHFNVSTNSDFLGGGNVADQCFFRCVPRLTSPCTADRNALVTASAAQSRITSSLADESRAREVLQLRMSSLAALAEPKSKTSLCGMQCHTPSYSWGTSILGDPHFTGL